MRKYTLPLFFSLLAGVLHGQSFVNGQAAWAVIGQNTFSSGAAGIANSAGNIVPAQNVLGGPSGLAWANGKLWVADSNRVGASPQDNRVLEFDTTQIPGRLADVRTLSPVDNICSLCGYFAIDVLGEPDYVSAGPQTRSAQSLTTPTAVATDGTILAIADTDNNRVLIWKSIPTSIDQPADIVLGQKDFSSFQQPQPVNANSLRGPQGVWIQNGKLFVADTQNYRVLVWNQIPTQNNQAADFVLGQPNLTSANAPPVEKTSPTAAANMLLNPVSVTSDGTHLFVADLGFNRVLIWNSIPSSMDQPADVVVGQPDMTSTEANNPAAGCATAATDVNGNRLPCEATLNFPRYALSDGHRLFIADGGNDRVLIFNSIPTANGAKADVVLGQPDFVSDVVTSQSITITSTAIDNTGSVDTVPSPMSLAFDGTNLYVGDPFNRRVLVFTPGDTVLPANSVVNWASEIVRQEGVVSIFLTTGGAITASDTVTVSIQSTNYTYTVTKNDTLDTIAQGLVNLINANAGDPNATALFAGAGTGSLYLSSKAVDLPYDTISLSASASNTANLTVTASGAYLSAGTAATGAPAMLVEINGANLSDQTVAAAMDGETLQTQLAGVEVFMDGIATPLLSVSPTQIVTQIPYWFTNSDTSGNAGAANDRNSTSVYVRTTHSDGSVTVTNATPVYIAPANPGLFNQQSYPGQPRPWPAVGALHQAGNPSAVVSIDGTANAGDQATITINGANYTYTVQTNDTLASIVNGLVALINATDQNVTAAPGGAFTRVVLTAKLPGAAGNNISVAGSANSTAQVTVTAYSSSTCCDVQPGSPITAANPAAPGELIQVMGAGLGVLSDSTIPVNVGSPFNGTIPNSVSNFVTATLGGQTAQVISAGFGTGSYGQYDIQMVVPAGLPNSNFTPLYIAQNAFISNIVTIAVGPPVAPQPAAGAGLTAGQVLVNPTNVTFAQEALGTLSPTQTVSVFNTGSSTLTIGGIQISGTNASNFSQTNTCGTSVAVGQSCTVSVSYNGASGSQSATLSISDSAPGSPHTVALTGSAVGQFIIVSKLDGKVLDVTNISTSNGAPIQQWDYWGGAGQIWSLTPTSDGYYEIVSSLDGKVLDVRGVSTDDGAVVQQYDYLGGDNQKWSLVPTSDGYFEIVNKLSGKVLDITNISTASGAVIQQWDWWGGDNQKWSMVPVQYYEIVNVQSGKVLDDTALSTSDGSLIQQWDYVGGQNQQWQLLPEGNQYYQVVNRLSGKVLDVTAMGTANGTQIQQWDSWGGDNQKWAFQATDVSGAFAVVNKNSGRVLDVTGMSNDDGAIMQQWDYLGGANQKWQLVPVTNP